MNNIIVNKSSFSFEVSRTTPLQTRVLRLILKIQDLFHSYVITPLRNMTSTLPASTMSVISQRKQLNSTALITISNELQKKERVEVLQSFLFPVGMPSLKAEKNLLLIPVVLKGRLENHIVLLAMDKEKKQILFYDSKGWTLEDHVHSQTIGNVCLKDIFKTLLKENDLTEENNFSGYTLRQNTQRVQKDSHNCGVYVAHAMNKLSNKKNPLENPLSFSQADTEAREDLIRNFNLLKS